MSDHKLSGRALGATEYTWCRAVPGGTGVAVLAFLTTKKPNPSTLAKILQRLHVSHPILRAKLQNNNNKFSFSVPSTPCIKIKEMNLSSTFDILQKVSNTLRGKAISPFHLLLEHELNQNSCFEHITPSGTDVFRATIYELSSAKWVLVLRVHGTACDRTTAVSMLRELLVLTKEEETGVAQNDEGEEGKFHLGLEDLVPRGKRKKTLWAKGVDMLSYSLNSLRMTNLIFKDVRLPRSSEVVRLQMNQQETARLLAGCNKRGIKLCGALSAAALIAEHSSRDYGHRQQKYAVVTLTDCRSTLEPPLSAQDFGFYHSAVHNIHAMKGGENLWELAQKTYRAFMDSKSNDKHLTEMGVHNFLMCKAIENPGLTASSSLRVSFITVFEDTVIDDTKDMRQEAGVEDYMGCASIHGVGPSVGMFDIIRDGKLDCICVYPSPLHSREQMERLVDAMKSVLVNAGF